MARLQLSTHQPNCKLQSLEISGIKKAMSRFFRNMSQVVTPYQCLLSKAQSRAKILQTPLALMVLLRFASEGHKNDTPISIIFPVGKREINKITFKISSVISDLTSKLCRSMLPAGMIRSLEKQLDGQKTQSWSVHGLWRSSHLSMLCHAVPHLGLIRFNIRPILTPPGTLRELFCDHLAWELHILQD